MAGVLLFHTGNLPGGFLGVDLFFVLSGFLITGLLLREAETRGRIALLSFAGRRLRRLFPALAVLLVVVTVAVWTLERFGSGAVDRGMVASTLSDGPWVQLHLVNWHLLAQDASYWEAFGQARVFEHLWSIAVEEQFYLVWPLLVAAITWAVARRRSGSPRPDRRGGISGIDAAVATVAVVLSVSSLVVMVALYDAADPTRVYTGTDTRTFSLLLGATAATAPARDAFGRMVLRSRALVGWLIGVLTAAILLSWAFVHGTGTPGLFTGGLFAHASACAILVGLCAALSTMPAKGSDPEPAKPSALKLSVPMWILPVWILRTRFLTWLGGLSYGLYLWHWPVVVLFPEQEPGGLPHWPHSVLVIAGSIGLAWVSKRRLEDPIRFHAPWARGRTGLVVFLFVSAVLFGMWYVLPLPPAPSIDIGGL